MCHMKLQETVKNGMWVSTVQLYVPEGWELEWETMVFPKEGDWGDLFCWRYDNEADARKGHDIVVALLNSRVMEES